MTPQASAAASDCCRLSKYEMHAHDVRIHAQTNGFSVNFKTQSHMAIDQIIDMIVAWSHDDAANMTMQILPAISPLPERSRFLNHVRIDLDPDKDIASIRLVLFAQDGTPMPWYPRSDTIVKDHGLCWDTWNAPECMFPDDAVISIIELRHVVHQFYDLHGGGLPDVIAWRPAGDHRW